jgi:hypothetical protein
LRRLSTQCLKRTLLTAAVRPGIAGRASSALAGRLGLHLSVVLPGRQLAAIVAEPPALRRVLRLIRFRPGRPMAVKKLLLLAVLALGLAGCGSGGESAETQATAGEVEAQLEAEVAAGGVVDLDGTAPKSITCEKHGGPSGWRCRIAPGPRGGEDTVCLVTFDESTRTVTTRTCGSLEN